MTALAPAAAEALQRRMLPAVIAARRSVGPDHLAVLTIRHAEGGLLPPFQAGQFVSLGMATPAGFVVRPYSIASCPLDRDVYELFVVRVEGGALTPHLFSAAPGTPIGILPPKGAFTLARAATRTVVMVATGTGLAPFLSQVRTLHRLYTVGIPAGYRVILMHGCAHADEAAFREELAGYAAGGAPGDFDFTYLATASRPEAGRGWDAGFGSGRVDQLFLSLFDLPTDPRRTVALPAGIDKAHLRDLIRSGPASLMVCGNPGMIDHLREPARQLGMGSFLVEEYWKA